MSELSPSGGSEGCGARDDEVNVGDDAEVSDVALFRHSSDNLHRQVHAGPRAGGAARSAAVEIRNRRFAAAAHFSVREAMRLSAPWSTWVMLWLRPG